MKKLMHFFIVFLFIINTAGCSQEPTTAGDIIAKSVERHGGEALTDWETMVIEGEVNQRDNRLRFRGEYLLFARKPDKLRIERDLTKYERGRYFFTYIYNNGVGWSIRNLIPSYSGRYAEQYKRWLDKCDGIAYYAQNAEALILKPEETVNGKPAYVITAAVGNDSTNLYIDKKSFYLVQETYGSVKRVFSDFKKFGKTVHAARIDEITTSRRSANEDNFIYYSIEYNVPIDPLLFEEDMPREPGGTIR